MIYNTGGEHANYYTIKAAPWIYVKMLSWLCVQFGLAIVILLFQDCLLLQLNEWLYEYSETCLNQTWLGPVFVLGIDRLP